MVQTVEKSYDLKGSIRNRLVENEGKDQKQVYNIRKASEGYELFLNKILSKRRKYVKISLNLLG